MFIDLNLIKLNQSEVRRCEQNKAREENPKEFTERK